MDSLLVVSNVAFFLPAYLAYRRGYVYEGSIYVLMAIVSAFYHAVRVGYLVNFVMPVEMWHRLDYYNSFMMISRTALMVIYTENNPNVKPTFNLLIDTIGLIMVLAEIDTEIIVPVIFGIVVIFIIVDLVFFHDTLNHVDIADMTAGFGLLLCASLCYFLPIPTGYYFLVHSIWHVLAALGIGLMIEATDSSWTLVAWLYYGIRNCCRKRNNSGIQLNLP